jgi:hypothetical protein
VRERRAVRREEAHGRWTQMRAAEAVRRLSGRPLIQRGVWRAWPGSAVLTRPQNSADPQYRCRTPLQPVLRSGTPAIARRLHQSAPGWEPQGRRGSAESSGSAMELEISIRCKCSCLVGAICTLTHRRMLFRHAIKKRCWQGNCDLLDNSLADFCVCTFVTYFSRPPAGRMSGGGR